MKIGQLVEDLIRLRDNHKGELSISEDEAVCEACNLLDKLPRGEEATTYEPLKN